MKVKLTATAALLIAALGIATGSAAAAPEPEAVGFSATAGDRSTVITTDAGSMAVEDGVFKIKSGDTIVAGTELAFRLDEFVFPIAADIDGRTATLTPQLALDKAVYKPVALPYEDQAPWKTEYEREQAAWSRLTSTIAAGATIGTLIGGIAGAGLGCVLGGIVGATVASATLVGLFGPFIPAAALGCVGGMAAVGFLGTIIGQIFVTGPVAIAAAIQYFSTINQPAPKPAPAK
ncbi:hypothetical protein [Nocardia bovistercoris]|uniref:DUF8020 domain-containing protein n=1 Tax=Nocardia bovistercoris TaxID=2785916 RepID=A0A931N1V6_9NOCA|nr:hypothetical protein [Nocardia bovistercoris]MBH0774863.1 hypothetical protein [Nocardia bovistercoris]